MFVNHKGRSIAPLVYREKVIESLLRWLMIQDINVCFLTSVLPQNLCLMGWIEAPGKIIYCPWIYNKLSKSYCISIPKESDGTIAI